MWDPNRQCCCGWWRWSLLLWNKTKYNISESIDAHRFTSSIAVIHLHLLTTCYEHFFTNSTPHGINTSAVVIIRTFSCLLGTMIDTYTIVSHTVAQDRATIALASCGATKSVLIWITFALAKFRYATNSGNTRGKFQNILPPDGRWRILRVTYNQTSR